MALIVQKYGGTSVGTIERIRNVADRVIRTKKNNNQVVVVVSAMAGKTDELIKLAHEITPTPDPREMDVLLATGEQVSIALLSMALKEKGVEAKSYLGGQAGIITDDAFGKARIQSIASEAIKKDLDDGKVVVVAGFQGIDEKNNITTLGRGGSDTTAVALAAALNADLCEIYTDVEGVFTTDPNVYRKARKIKKISYEEMLEMSSMGAKVLQIRSVEFAKKYNVVLHVRSSFTDEPGTIVCQEDEEMEDVLVSGVTYNKNEAKITIKNLPDRPGIAAKIFSEIGKANIVVDMIIQTPSTQGGHANLTFTVPIADFEQTLKISQKLAKELEAGEVVGFEDIAKISIIGVGMRSHTNIASKMFEALANEGINIMMISTSEIKISCLIDQKYTELAVRALHDAFELDKPPAEDDK